MKDFIASEKFLIGSNGQVGGVAPNAVNDIIKWDGTKWIAGVNPGGNGGGSAVAEPFTISLNSGSTTYSVVFPEPFDIAPSIATDLEITGDGPIIPYTISNLTTNGYDVIFAKEIPNNNYKIHTVFGGGGGGTGGGDSTLSGESLQEIDRQIVSNAVDIFVYNTQQDSDGGAWRSRTSHTSWYNEPLNTATRGSRREFPAVAVIVAEADKVTIYDGDDPDLSMWMVFEDVNSGSGLIPSASAKPQSIAALNGIIVFGNAAGSFNSGQAGVLKLNFIADVAYRYMQSSSSAYSGKWVGGGLANRNAQTPTLGSWDNSLNYIINNDVNDVAMTVFSNAPIDSDTGLPVPTIAVATNGGVSVIKDDGSVVDYTCTYSSNNKYSLINFIEGSKLLACSRDGETYPTVFDIPGQDKASFDSTDIVFSANPSDGSSAADIRVGNYSEYKASAVTKENIVIGGESLIISNIDNVSGDQTADNVIISSSYNTGWMPGDIKLAALSDTKIETVGADESTELISNNKFDTGTEPTGWETHLGTSSVVANQAVLDGSGVTDANLITEINCEVGKRYEFKIDSFRSSGSNSYNISVSTGPGSLFHQTVIAGVNKSNTTMETTTIQFVATQETHYVGVKCNGNPSNAVITIDNAYAKQTGELITNGTFDNGIENWIDQSSGTQSVDSSNVSAGELTLTRLNSDVEQVSQLLNLVEGKRYVLSFDVTASINDRGQVWIGIDLPLENQLVDGTYTAESILNTGNNLGVGSYLYTFTAGSTNYLSIRVGANDTISWDNISVRLAEEDRSVNDKGLQIFGEIDKTPVASGADLVAYSGFSANDYLMQPYNSNLDFGTGDFCIMGWAKNSDSSSTYKTLLYRNTADISGNDLGTRNGNSGWQIMLNTLGQLYCHVYGDGNNFYGIGINSGFSLTDGSWHQFAVTYTGGVTKIFIDGIMKNSISVHHGNFDNSQAILSVGSRPVTSSSLQFTGSLALIRVGKTAPTAEQIAKIYRDEKPLFQDGAQSTLYGTSDAVTALAYDDSENLLHVGTASGRSVFNGLKRVDNTTTAVSTAISATEGLVIEQ